MILCEGVTIELPTVDDGSTDHPGMAGSTDRKGRTPSVSGFEGAEKMMLYKGGRDPYNWSIQDFVITHEAVLSRPNRIIGLMLALSAMSYFDRTVLSIAAPAIIREFGISETAMGTVFSAFLVSYTALMTPGGALADRFGPRLVLGIATLGAAVTTGILAAPDPAAALIGIIPALFCARLLFGVFTAPLYPSCARMVSNWFPCGEHARVQALIISGAGAGAALSPFTF